MSENIKEDKITLINTLDEILSVKERRSFFYSSGAEISYIPKDVKIEIIDAGNRCLREIDILKGEDNEQKGRVSS